MIMIVMVTTSRGTFSWNIQILPFRINKHYFHVILINTLDLFLKKSFIVCSKIKAQILVREGKGFGKLDFLLFIF